MRARARLAPLAVSPRLSSAAPAAPGAAFSVIGTGDSAPAPACTADRHGLASVHHPAGGRVAAANAGSDAEDNIVLTVAGDLLAERS